MNLSMDNTLIRKRVLLGEDDDTSRRGNKNIIARSECRFYCSNNDILSRCIDAIRDSDEHLRNRPEERMLWDWQSTWVEYEQGVKEGGYVVLGVAWYNNIFFETKKSAYLNTEHLEKYFQIGLDSNNINVEHWVRA